MKRIILSLITAASVFAAVTAIAKTTSSNAEADCCNGSTCCAVGNGCCG